MTTSLANPAPDTSPRRRGLQRALYDAIGARYLQLHGARRSYRILRDVDVPMRDGVLLKADVLLADGSAKGTLLNRIPYGQPPLGAALGGSVYAQYGYNVVLVRSRGTFGSGGTLRPFVDERSDSADTVEWLRAQPWYGGRFATFGASYGGYTQWATLANQPADLVTCVLTVTSADFGRQMWRDGAFNLNTWLEWSEKMPRQEDGGVFAVTRMDRKRAPVIDAAKREIPLGRASEKLMGEGAPWYREWVTSRDEPDTLSAIDQSVALETTTVPVLMQVGWQDIFLRDGLDDYAALRARGVDVALTMGAWTHFETVLSGARVTVPDALRWFDEHFDGAAARSAPVRAFVCGGDEWIDLVEWPPPAEEQTLYPQAGGGIGFEAAEPGTTAAFTYDPLDPTPSIGGPLLSGGGYVDDSALSVRSDVLSFTSAPLTTAVRVMGVPRVVVAHSTDNPDCDIFVRLSKVDADGASSNVSEGLVRLDAATAEGEVTVELDATAQDFHAGECIRVYVAGGSLPRWERNLGTGANPWTSTETRSSARVIDLAASRLVLPVVAN